jgi:hypothetical protein
MEALCLKEPSWGGRREKAEDERQSRMVEGRKTRSGEISTDSRRG